jgi:predicted nucleic-acid-binding protein
MKSLDTNVLARFFIDDPDDAQAAKQRPAAVVALSQRAQVTVTVLLEFEWVMRGFYGLSRRAIAEVLRALAGIEHVAIEDRDVVLTSIDAFERGMDFADALHLHRSARAASFATFDRSLVNRARKLPARSTPTIELLR